MGLEDRVRFAPSPAAARLADDEMRRYGTPEQYVEGWVEMYGRRFMLDRRAFVPDRQTEQLVSEALRHIDRESLVLDVGTGCGWMPITVSLESGARVCSVDIEGGALEIAAHNARYHGLRPVNRMPKSNEIGFFRSSYAYHIPIDEPDIVIADLPWGDEDHIQNPGGREAQAHMPPTATFHPEGRFLGSYAELIRSLRHRDWRPRVFIETGLASERKVRESMADTSFTYHQFNDYSIAEIDMR